jgi:hypothetical protein
MIGGGAFAPLALSLSFTPAFAQQAATDPAASAEGDIVVEGERLTREEARHRAAVFVRTLGVVQGERSVARWTGPVCPRTKGLAPDHAALVEGWFRAIAERAGARLADKDCATNLLIAFVGNGDGFMALVKDHRPKTLFQVSGPDRQDLVGGDAPIRWWYTIAYGSGDGGGMSNTPSPVTGGNAEGGGSMLPDGVPVGGSVTGSLIRTGAIRSIAAATIVIDVNRAEGVPLKAATAFAAFVGLAEIKGSAEPPAASILNLFRDRQRASELSYWDREFLDELYRLALNRSGRRQRGRLIKAMVDSDNRVEEEAPIPAP